MKKLASIGLVGLLGMLVALSLAPSAQAYPAIQFDVRVNQTVVFAGSPVVGSASANVSCTWSIEWNQKTHVRSGHPDFSTTFTAPEVSERTVIPMHFTCDYVAPRTTKPAFAAAATWHRTLNVTVLPRDTQAALAASGASDLPNTGGPSVLFLIAGLALLVAGGTAVSVARRRKDGVEATQV